MGTTGGRKVISFACALACTIGSVVAVERVGGQQRAIAAEPSTVLVPARLLDTRVGPGNITTDGRFEGTGRTPAGSTLELVVADRGGVPADASAVMLNVAAVFPDDAGFLTVWPCDADRPGTSNVNFAGGEVVSNSVLAKVAGNGTVCIFTLTSTDIVVDVNGFVPPDGPLDTAVPARLLDTRPGPDNLTTDGSFQGVGRAAAGSVIELAVAGRGGVPQDARAAMLNVTAVYPDREGFLTVWPCTDEPPTTSNVNYFPGDVVPNAVLAQISDEGNVCIFTLAGTDVVVDVNGFIPRGGEASSMLPARLFESRSGPDNPTVDGLYQGGDRLAANSITPVDVVGRGGVLEGASSVVLNVTAVTPSSSGFITIFPCDEDVPTASNLNFAPGDVVANTVVASLAADGTVCIFTLSETDLVIDVNGQFVPFAPPAQFSMAALAAALSESDNQALPSAEVAIERESGIGGALCRDPDGGRVRHGANLPVLVCFDNATGLIKVENQASYWVSVVIKSGSAFVSGNQYDGSNGVRRSADLLYGARPGVPSTHLPPNGAIDFKIPSPYIGDVSFEVEIIRSASLIPTIVEELAGYLPNVGDRLALAIKLADILAAADQCLAAGGFLEDLVCAEKVAISMSWALIDAGIGNVLQLLGLPYAVSWSLIKVNIQLAQQIGEALAFYGNTFSIVGPGAPAPTTPTPVNQTLQPPVASGEVYAEGVRICGSTYSGHPAPSPAAKWSPSVDLNAVGGDYDRAITMPWNGTVSTYSTGYGNGWGNSVILTRSDGYQLFLAHLNAIYIGSGSASAGAIVGRAGNTGKTIGSNDFNGSHIHINASHNGQPATVMLGATAVNPGVCWTTRPGTTQPTQGVTSPAGATQTVRLNDGGARGASRWYDVQLSGFPANTSVAVACHDAVDRSFWTGTISIDAAGNGRNTQFCYSNIDGREVTAGGITATWNSSGATTMPSNPGTPPANVQTVALTQGAAAPYGHWYDVKLTGFSPNTTYAVQCHDSIDYAFYTAYIRTDGSGYGRDTTTCYSSLGGKSVTVDGLTATWNSSASRTNGTTPPPPPPSWSLTLARGSGYWYDLSISGPPGGTITVYCNDSVDLAFWTQSFTMSAGGTARDTTLCYSSDGPAHWVTSSVGATSNTVNW